MVSGSIASNFYGEPRATLDIDVAVLKMGGDAAPPYHKWGLSCRSAHLSGWILLVFRELQVRQFIRESPRHLHRYYVLAFKSQLFNVNIDYA
jgi:hypothetical protein